MPIIKLLRKDKTSGVNTWKQIVANSFEELVSKTETKFGFRPVKILLQDDLSEIDDEEVFNEIVKTDKPLNFLVLNLNDTRDAIMTMVSSLSSDTINSVFKNEMEKMKSEIEKMRVSNKQQTLDQTDDEKIRRETKDVEELRKRVQSMEKSQTLERERQKKMELEKKLNDLQESKINSKIVESKTIKELEDKCNRLELHNARINRLFVDLKKDEQVDICFLVDCTSSMRSYIEEAKNVIHKIVNKLSKWYQDFQIRFAFVGYRDHEYGVNRIISLPFVNNAESFKDFVSKVEVIRMDNTDRCEDVFGGLETALKLKWQNTSRVLYHIADAPCHGSRFHSNSVVDHYLNGDPRGLQVEDLMKSVAKLNLMYYFAKITDLTTKMIEQFDIELAKYIEYNKKITVQPLSSAAELFESVVSSIASTIASSKSSTLSSSSPVVTQKRTQKVKTLDQNINWTDLSKFKHYKADLFRPNTGNFKLANLKDYKKISFNKSTIEIYIALNPFARGGCRYAQAALLYNNRKRKWIKSVVKESRFSDESFNTVKYTEDSIESQTISCFLSKEFNKVSPSRKSIDFTQIGYIRLHGTGTVYSIEDYLPGKFLKWSNNAGFINKETYSATLDSFAHWTYQASNEYLVVTDLQGCRTSKNYMLTDPAITCPEDFDRFSHTNLGKKGLRKFFESHQCNHLCEKMGLKKHVYQVLENRKTTSAMTQSK